MSVFKTRQRNIEIPRSKGEIKQSEYESLIKEDFGDEKLLAAIEKRIGNDKALKKDTQTRFI